MGLEDGRMELSHAGGAYLPGQELEGLLRFTQRHTQSARGVYVVFKGVAKTRFKNGKQTFHGREEYFKSRLYLLGGQADEIQLQPGEYNLPFKFYIPDSCPPTFQTEPQSSVDRGYIKYKLKGAIDLAFQMDPLIKTEINVLSPLNLNLHQEFRDPLTVSVVDNYYSWCMSVGEVEVIARLPQSGYCPGQVVPLQLTCENKSNVSLTQIEVSIKRGVTLYSSRRGTKHVMPRKIIVKVAFGPVPGGTTRQWTTELQLPAQLDPRNTQNCQIIDLDFFLKVRVFPAGCHIGKKERKKLTIGTVPLQVAAAYPKLPASPYSAEPADPLVQYRMPSPYNNV